ncbi:hypothetical protein ACLMJK_006836 [Lecanora helva]
MSSNPTTASSQQLNAKSSSSLGKRRFAHLMRPLCPLLSIETGLPHPDFPKTLLHYHLLTDNQLDDLAHFYHQRTPSWYSMGYPMPVVTRWWAPGNERDLEEGEIDEMEDIRQMLGVINQQRSDTVAGTEEKRRRFGRFLGLRHCESAVGEGNMRRQMEEWLADELAKRQHRDRELESWRSKGHF